MVKRLMCEASKVATATTEGETARIIDIYANPMLAVGGITAFATGNLATRHVITIDGFKVMLAVFWIGS